MIGFRRDPAIGGMAVRLSRFPGSRSAGEVRTGIHPEGQALSTRSALTTNRVFQHALH